MSCKMSRFLYTYSHILLRYLLLATSVVAIAGCTTVVGPAAPPAQAVNADPAADAPSRSVPTREPEPVEQSPVSSPPEAPPEMPPDQRLVQAVLATLSLEERVGQLIMPALPPDARGAPMVGPDHVALARLRSLAPGGVILFGDNLVSREQTEELIEAIQAGSRLPLIVAIDQEGGVVSRLASAPAISATPIPSAARVGLAEDPLLAEAVARIVGSELAALGFTMNFAPVADLRTTPDNPITRSRSFGVDPDRVSPLVAATVRGLQAENVSAVVKHFPGHGASSVDTHVAPATIEFGLDRLLDHELRPFVAGIDAGADGVMVGHLSVPAVTGSSLPATLSAALTTDLLRLRLRFDGVIVTDSLVMGALAGVPGETPVGLRAFEAGADMLLLPPDPDALRDAILAAVRSGDLSEERIDASVARILRIKVRRGLINPPVAASSGPFSAPARYTRPGTAIGTADHRAVVQRVLELSTR